MLTINQLTKTYSNGVRALDGINLTIPKGMFGLLGPNGAGKSSINFGENLKDFLSKY